MRPACPCPSGARTCARSTMSSPPSLPCALRGRSSGVSWSSSTTVVPVTATSCSTSAPRASCGLSSMRCRTGTSGTWRREAWSRSSSPAPGSRARAPRSTCCPMGRVVVLATHEQVLGRRGRAGVHGVPVPGGARPMPPAWRTTPRMVGERLAARGVVGRASIDFAAACDATGAWGVHALEVNLRKGGTTHPYAALRNLVPGRYDEDAGGWIADDGSERSYWSTDNLVDPAWHGLRPAVGDRPGGDRGAPVRRRGRHRRRAAHALVPRHRRPPRPHRHRAHPGAGRPSCTRQPPPPSVGRRAERTPSPESGLSLDVGGSLQELSPRARASCRRCSGPCRPAGACRRPRGNGRPR